MRSVAGQLIELIRRYPAIVDGAFVIIAWVGIKLLAEYLHSVGILHFEIPKWLSMGLIVVIFVASYLYARSIGPVDISKDPTVEAERRILAEEAGQERGEIYK